MERQYRSLALRGKRPSGSATSRSFFRDNRMDNGLTSGDKFHGEEDNNTIHRGWENLKLGQLGGSLGIWCGGEPSRRLRAAIMGFG
jgi:hypothetical protein